MKLPTTPIQVTCGAMVILLTGFCLGGMYTSGKAVRALNQLSIAEDTGIEEALEQRDYQRAGKIADDAVNAHLDYLRSWSNPPFLNRAFFLVPWTGLSESNARLQLHYLRGFYADHPGVLNLQNEAFVSSQP